MTHKNISLWLVLEIMYTSHLLVAPSANCTIFLRFHLLAFAVRRFLQVFFISDGFSMKMIKPGSRRGGIFLVKAIGTSRSSSLHLSHAISSLSYHGFSKSHFSLWSRFIMIVPKRRKQSFWIALLIKRLDLTIWRVVA